MPTHNYTAIPHEDETFGRAYNTGIPSTAPPSFHSVPLSTQRAHLPHRNDESAATIMPREERERFLNDGHSHGSPSPAILEDDPVSIWAPSESNLVSQRDLEAAREDAIAKLMERVERLEKMAEGGKELFDVSVEKSMSHGWRMCGTIAAWIGMILVMVWIFGIITLSVYQGGRSKE